MTIKIKQELRRLIDSLSIVSGTRYYSQLAEDAILAKYFYRVKRRDISFIERIFGFEPVKVGFYIDIGAYSPKRYSNTYYFYKNGWTGITVEPNLKAEKWFRMIRPKDTHLCVAVGNPDDGKFYYHANGYSGENFISSSSKIIRQGYVPQNINVMSLKDIFSKYVPENIIVDLISIDCEGHDLSILKTNDWSKYRPSVVVAETCSESEITKFMIENSYELLASTIGSVLYRDSLNKELKW